MLPEAVDHESILVLSLRLIIEVKFARTVQQLEQWSLSCTLAAVTTALCASPVRLTKILLRVLDVLRVGVVAVLDHFVVHAHVVLAGTIDPVHPVLMVLAEVTLVLVRELG